MNQEMNGVEAERVKVNVHDKIDYVFKVVVIKKIKRNNEM